MEAAAPKVDFFTPATFKHVAEHLKGLLKQSAGYDWYVHGVQKNNRKIQGGTELYFSAKVIPADKTKPLLAEVEASLTTDYRGPAISVMARVEYRFKTLFEQRAEPKTFAEAQHFFASLNIPAHVFEETKTASTLPERVAFRYLLTKV
jgi:hypothetical protein